jgi:hypothetical protein
MSHADLFIAVFMSNCLTLAFIAMIVSATNLVRIHLTEAQNQTTQNQHD